VFLAQSRIWIPIIYQLVVNLVLVSTDTSCSHTGISIYKMDCVRLIKIPLTEWTHYRLCWAATTSSIQCLALPPAKRELEMHLITPSVKLDSCNHSLESNV